MLQGAARQNSFVLAAVALQRLQEHRWWVLQLLLVCYRPATQSLTALKLVDNFVAAASCMLTLRLSTGRLKITVDTSQGVACPR